jgi:hypothetical protein
MSSSAYVRFEPETTDVAQAHAGWDQFCAEHGIVLDPHVAGEPTYYAGRVEVCWLSEELLSFGTFFMGADMPEVAELAHAFWLKFGGYLSMSDEVRAVWARTCREG